VVDDVLIATAHRLGLAIHAWVIDDPHQVTALLDRSVDGIMSDDLDALRSVFAQRGHWPQTRGAA
jgi:glycerophosphoryl diester phosphodiesterase